MDDDGNKPIYVLGLTVFRLGGLTCRVLARLG
jgi:hypothetical protein